MPNVLNVALLRQNDNSGEAVLRLSTVVSLSGCMKVEPLRHDVEVNDMYLDVVVKGYDVNLIDSKKGCPQGAQQSIADIPLDRQLIADNGIEQIRLVLDRGLGSDYYLVNLGTDRLELTPTSQKIFKPGKRPAGGQIALSHWYYPKETLVLTAPRPGVNQETGIIEAFAKAYDLTPLVQLMPDFIVPSGQPGRYYYVDTTGAMAATIVNTNNVTVGDGIYARRPGLYE